MLGDILANLTDETTALEAILGTGDLALLAAARERAAAEDIDLAACVIANRAALRRAGLR